MTIYTKTAPLGCAGCTKREIFHQVFSLFSQVCLDKSNTLRYTNYVRKIIDETLVEWDDNKNHINIRKHGISFETAALVFADEERIEYYDKLHSQDED